LHPDTPVPPHERIFWLKHGRLPPDSTRTHEVSLDDDDTEGISASCSHDPCKVDPARDPATGKWRVEEGDPPVLYLPVEEAVYWAEHGHAPPGSERTHDLDNNDLKDFETFYCVSAPSPVLQRLDS
jgi:hypothetical protein